MPFVCLRARCINLRLTARMASAACSNGTDADGTFDETLNFLACKAHFTGNHVSNADDPVTTGYRLQRESRIASVAPLV
jgi:hypothetical protein